MPRMPVTAPIIAVHVLLLVAGAFLVGLRLFRETHPRVGRGGDDSVQARRVATAATIALFLIIVLLIAQADLGMFHTARMMR